MFRNQVPTCCIRFVSLRLSGPQLVQFCRAVLEIEMINAHRRLWALDLESEELILCLLLIVNI